MHEVEMTDTHTIHVTTDDSDAEALGIQQALKPWPHLQRQWDAAPYYVLGGIDAYLDLNDDDDPEFIYNVLGNLGA